LEVRESNVAPNIWDEYVRCIEEKFAYACERAILASLRKLGLAVTGFKAAPMLRLRVSANAAGVISAGEDFDAICNFFHVLIRTLGALEVPNLAKDRSPVRLFRGFAWNSGTTVEEKNNVVAKTSTAIELEGMKSSFMACVERFRLEKTSKCCLHNFSPQKRAEGILLEPISTSGLHRDQASTAALRLFRRRRRLFSPRLRGGHHATERHDGDVGQAAKKSEQDLPLSSMLGQFLTCCL